MAGPTDIGCRRGLERVMAASIVSRAHYIRETLITITPTVMEYSLVHNSLQECHMLQNSSKRLFCLAGPPVHACTTEGQSPQGRGGTHHVC
jgi:hypothetical protein